MPAPTNIDLAHATDLGILVGSTPNTVTQNIRDGSTNYTVWYKYTAVAGDNVIGIFPFGDVNSVNPTYRPNLSIYLADSSSIGILGVNCPIQFPVTSGITYYFRIQPSGGTGAGASTLTLSIYRHVDEITPVGSLVVNDDTPGFPAAILSATDGHVLRFVQNVSAGEALASQIPAKKFLASDTNTGNAVLLSNSLATLATIAFDTDFCGIQAHPDGLTFYVGNSDIGGHAVVRPVNLNGVLSAPIATLPGPGLTVFAVNVAKTILYYYDSTSLKRWDITNNIALSDLAATVVGYTIFPLLIVLGNDTIIAGYHQNASPHAVQIRHYGSNGTVLATWTLNDIDCYDCRLAPGLNDGEFWLWRKYGDSPHQGRDRFTRIRVSDGTLLNDFDSVWFESGVYGPIVQTATPLARFGHSESCHFAVLPDILADLTNRLSGIYQLVPGKTNDTYHNQLTLEPSGYGDTINMKIPDPYIIVPTE